MCKKFMIGATKPVSLLFDLPTYMTKSESYYVNVDPLTPHFKINKTIGCQGANIIFYFLSKNIDCMYSPEPGFNLRNNVNV